MEEMASQCVAVVSEWLASGTVAGWLKLAYWAGGAAIAVFALFALRSRVTQGRANFLFHLDRRWADLMEARREIDKLRIEITELVASEHKQLANGAREIEFRKACATRLKTMQHERNSAVSYDSALQLCGFFEFVGLMARRKYVSIEDVVALLRGPIENFERIFADHITDREKETGMPSGLLEHALWLSRETRKRDSGG